MLTATRENDITSRDRSVPGLTHRNPRYFMSNLIASCAQPDTGGPFDEVSGR